MYKGAELLMNLRSVVIASVVGLALFSARGASAQEFIAGIQAQFLTAGTVTAGDVSVDAHQTGALAADVEYVASPNVSFGFAPRLAFEVGPRGDVDRGAQLDLMGHLTGRVPVTKRLTPFAYVAAGLSLVAVPSAPKPLDGADGAALGLGGGAAFRVSDEIEVVLDVGYQWGFQRQEGDLNGQTIAADYRLDDLHIGVGAQTYLR